MLRWLLVTGIAAAVVLEIYFLLAMGTWLGVGWTMAWMAGSCVIGLLMVRWAGLRTLLRIHHKLRQEILPTTELMDMGMILLGGLLLVLPGFISDGAGVLLLLGPVRWSIKAVLCLAFGSLLPSSTPVRPMGNMGEEVIEVQAEDVT